MATDINVGDQYYLTKAQYATRKAAGTLVPGGQYYITDEIFPSDVVIRENYGRVYVQASAPTGHSNDLWIDTTNGNIAKYWDGTTWTTVKAVWG